MKLITLARHGFAVAAIVAATSATAATGYVVSRLGTGEDSEAYDINNRGQIVGTTSYLLGAGKAFVADTTAGFRLLEHVPDGRETYRHSYAGTINEAGEVLGESLGYFDPEGSGTVWIGVGWNAFSGRLDPSLPVGIDINNKGEVLQSYNRVVDRATRSVRSLDIDHGWAMAFNDAGEYLVQDYDSAYLWSETKGFLADLGAIHVRDLNNRHQVVGYNDDGAVFWSRETGLVTLADVVQPGSGVSRLLEAKGINERGQIVGAALFDDYASYGALLLNPVAPPVPEPATLPLLLAGLAGVALTTRRGKPLPKR